MRGAAMNGDPDIEIVDTIMVVLKWGFIAFCVILVAMSIYLMVRP